MDIDLGDGNIIKSLPCTLKYNQLKCSGKGPSYPNSAISEYVEDNKALLRRMFGIQEVKKKIVKKQTTIKVIRTFSPDKYEVFVKFTIYVIITFSFRIVFSALTEDRGARFSRYFHHLCLLPFLTFDCSESGEMFSRGLWRRCWRTIITGTKLPARWSGDRRTFRVIPKRRPTRRTSASPGWRSTLPTGHRTVTGSSGPSSTTRSSSRPSTRRSARTWSKTKQTKIISQQSSESPPHSGVTATVPASRSTSGTDCWPTTLTTTVPGYSWTGSSSQPAAPAGYSGSTLR